jgi:hypothetical protein
MSPDALKKLLAAAADVAGIAVPIVADVKAAASLLGAIAKDLQNVPLDANGQPVTLEAASAHLAASTAASATQDEAIRLQAHAALKDNGAE